MSSEHTTAEVFQETQQIERRLDEILAEVKKLHSAFPETEKGEVDFEGHRKYHEEMIKAAQAQTQFWAELRLDIAKKGVWSLLTIICGLVIVGLSAKMGLGIK
jgi:hypothetical protein